MKMGTCWTCRLISLDHVSTQDLRPVWPRVVFCETGNVTTPFIDETPFYGGIFRCKLVIDGDFPNKPPKGFFLTKIFHPNVATPSGDICVNTLKRDWNPAKWSLSHIFQIIRCLLIVPFPESALNEEAGRLFMENYDEYFSQAKLYTGIHAKPTAQQAQIMAEHHSKSKQIKTQID